MTRACRRWCARMNFCQDAVLVFTRCLRGNPIHPIHRRSLVACWSTGKSYRIFRFLGHVDDIGSVWAQAHAAILPSRREGLPKSLLEAAACGRPLIASDVPGCREIARHNVNALLVPPDDPEALAHAIVTLMNDPGMRIRFGRTSRQIVMSEFSSARIGSAIVLLYARLLVETAPSEDRAVGRVSQ